MNTKSSSLDTSCSYGMYTRVSRINDLCVCIRALLSAIDRGHRQLRTARDFCVIDRQTGKRNTHGYNSTNVSRLHPINVWICTAYTPLPVQERAEEITTEEAALGSKPRRSRNKNKVKKGIKHMFPDRPRVAVGPARL